MFIIGSVLKDTQKQGGAEMNYLKLRAKLVEQGISAEQLAMMIGIAASTLRNKLAGRTEFTQREISDISRCLGITREEILDIFFDEKVS